MLGVLAMSVCSHRSNTDFRLKTDQEGLLLGRLLYIAILELPISETQAYFWRAGGDIGISCCQV